MTALTRILSCAVFLVTIIGIVPSNTQASAADCSDEVKRALTNSQWVLRVEYNRGGPKSFRLKTRVAADGTMEVARGRNRTEKITCDGKKIYFDRDNDIHRRYTMTLEKDGDFHGSRPGHGGGDYYATLKKTGQTASIPEGKTASIPEVRPRSGTYEVARGKKIIVYSIKSKGCDSKPPTFANAIERNAKSGGTDTNPTGGTLYDAGITRFRSRSCGGWVMARGIGFKADPSFTGVAKLKFRRNEVEITVK